MIKIIIGLISLIFTSHSVWAQPIPCNPNSANWTITTTAATLKICNSDGSAWLSVISGGVPSGTIIASLTTCGTGWEEATELNGKTLVGTLAANGNVGTTGGNDNITPAGSNSVPTFTGSALAAHSHELPFQISTTTTIRQIAAATFGTGTSRAATGVSAAGSANTTSAAIALSESKSAGTPAGTVTAPTFTGTQFDNRSAFTRVIFCKKS